MRTILVPLDGSPLAELGLRAARRAAVELGAELLLLRSVLFLSAAQGEERENERTEIQEASAYLEEIQQRQAGQGIRARTLILPGDPVRAILFAAEAERVEMISMATHGQGGAMGRLLGSVTAAVLRATDRPVLVTRADAPPPDEPGPFRTIVVGLDGTAFAEGALAFLAESGLGREATNVLARAVETGSAGPAMGLVSERVVARIVAEARQVTERHLQDAEAYLLATAGAALPERHCRPVVAAGEPDSLLVDLARGEHADLVVLATHGRRGMDRLLHGSVAQAVLRHSGAPVLILHGAEVADRTPVATHG